MLTKYEKHCIEKEMVNIIRQTPGGIDTRELISEVVEKLHSSIPLLNKRHVASMIARVTEDYGFRFKIKTQVHSATA